MLSRERRVSVARAAKRVADHHGARIRECLESLSQYDLRRNSYQAGSIAKDYRARMEAAVSLFGDELVAEVVRVARALKVHLGDEERDQILEICSRHLNAEYYQHCWRSFEDALQRTASRYGQTVDLDHGGIIHEKLLFEVASKNRMTRIRSRLSEELQLMSYETQELTSSDRLLQAVEMRPGAFGFSLDLKALWKWVRGRRDAT